MKKSRLCRVLPGVAAGFWLAVATGAFAQSGIWTTGASMPGASYGLNAVFLNGKVYAISGFATNRIGIYDTVSNSWTTGAALPADSGYNLRQYFGSAVVNGKIYVIGGDTGGSGARATNYIYNPATNSWSSGAPLPTARWGDVAVTLNGKIYVIGGYDGTNYISRVDIYDPVANSWSAGTALPSPRHFPFAGVINGKIYVAGGVGSDNNASNSTFVFDPASPGAWTNGDAMPISSAGASVVLSGKLFAIGGSPTPNTPGAQPDTKVISYDPAAHQWSQNYNLLPTPRHDLGLAADDGSGKIYAVGGYGNGSTKSVLEILSLASLPPIITSQLNLDFLGANESFDPVTQGWSSKTHMPTARRSFGLVAGTGIQDGTDGTWAGGPAMPGASYGLKAAFVNGKLYAISGFATNRIGIYDPVANSWTTGAGLPSDTTCSQYPTDGHFCYNLRQYFGCAVVNGKIYVIGGDTGGSGFEPTNYEYNTATNSWATKAPLPGPVRYGQSAVALTGKVYVFGGFDGTNFSSRLDIYDPSNNTWSTGPSLPSPRTVAMTEVINGKIYIFAGADASGTLTSGLVFDPVAGTYSPAAPIPVFLGGGGGYAVLNNNLYVVGGGPNPQSAVESYDPVSDTWTTNYPPMPTGRHDLAAAADPATNRIFAVGGYFSSILSTLEILTINPPSPRLYAAGGKVTSGCTPISAFEAYNPVVDNWATLAAPLPTARSDLGAAAVSDQLYFIGGDTGCGDVVATNESYSLTNKAWTARSPMNVARSNPGVATINGQVYVVGGDDGAGTALKSLERYDPGADAWSPLPAMPTARIAPVVEVLNNTLYVIGGYDAAHPDGLTTVEAYNPGSNNWTPGLAPMLTSRGLGAAGGVLNNQIYVFGGENDSHETSANEIYDPATDTWSVAPALPTSRFGLGGAVINNRLYAVGGRLQGIATIGLPFVYQITATNSPTYYDVDPATPLPPGLQIDHLAGLIFGTPIGDPSKDNDVRVIASNAAGAGAADVIFSIQAAPDKQLSFAHSTTLTGKVGQLFGQPGTNGTGFQVVAHNVRAPAKYSAGGLPPGLSINQNNGLISGTPTATGNFAVSISITDQVATASTVLQFSIVSDSSTATISSPNTITLIPGQAVNYTITAAGPSATFSYIGTDGMLHTDAGGAGLPGGLSFDGVNKISGTYNPDSANGSNVQPRTLKIRPPLICSIVSKVHRGAGGSSRTEASGGAGDSISTGVGTLVFNEPVVTFSFDPPDKTAEATGPNGAAVTFSIPTAKDEFNNDAPVVCDAISGAIFPIGQTVVNCTATAASGATAEAYFTVTVQDTTKPVITVPTVAAVEATSANGAVVSFTAPSWTDAVDGSGQADADHHSGDMFPIGDTVVHCWYTDAHGNTGTNTFTVTVQDTTKPIITVPTIPTAEATSANGVVVTFTAPSWTDAVDGSGQADSDHQSGETFPIGSTVVHCSHTDTHGNAGTKTFTVTVQDTTPPNISVPTVAPVEADGSNGAMVTFATPTWTDAVDGNGTAATDHNSGDIFPVGDTIVHCSHADAHGNPGSNTFTITVSDKTAPVITAPASLTVVGPKAKKGQQAHGTANFTVCATDVVDGAVTAVASPSSGTSVTNGTVVTVTAADIAGNQATANFTVTVVTKAPKTKRSKKTPVMSVSAAQTINEGQDATVTFSISASPASALTLTYQIGGNALAGSQYTLNAPSCAPGQLVIPAGGSSVSIGFHARKTAATTGSETITITLLGGSGYTVSPTAGTSTVTINNGP